MRSSLKSQLKTKNIKTLDNGPSESLTGSMNVSPMNSIPPSPARSRLILNATSTKK